MEGLIRGGVLGIFILNSSKLYKKIHDKAFPKQAQSWHMTKSQIFFIILLVAIFKSNLGWSYSTAQDCPYQNTRRNNLQFSQQFQKDIAECMFSIHPQNAYQNLFYRSYLVTSSGLLFVFNSYGDGSTASTTGAREYYFFPREPYTGGVELTAGVVSIRMNSKLTLQFESKNLYPLNNSNLVLKNLLSISPKNAGGVEVLKYRGVYLDVGFMMGKAPSSIGTHKSMFKNQFGQKCSIQNNNIFDYKDGEPRLQHDLILKKIVAAQCPAFKWID